MKQKIDPIEIETYEEFTLFWKVLTVFILIGLIVVIFSPYIIDYFTQ